MGDESANIRVWFEAEGVNPASMVVQQGAPGGDLVIACETERGFEFCEWDIAMMMEWDTGEVVSVISSMATDILGDTEKHMITDFLIGDYPLDGYLFEEINEDGLLADTRGVEIPVKDNPPVFVPIPPGEYTFLEARLTTLATADGDPSDAIDMQINSLLWTLVADPAGPVAPDALVQFGDADPIPGDLEGGLAEDVIVVLAVGDVNCDRAVDARDIGSFSQALLDPASYAALNPNCNSHLGDINGDGETSLSDIEQFVQQLLEP